MTGWRKIDSITSFCQLKNHQCRSISAESLTHALLDIIQLSYRLHHPSDPKYHYKVLQSLPYPPTFQFFYISNPTFLDSVDSCSLKQRKHSPKVHLLQKSCKSLCSRREHCQHCELHVFLYHYKWDHHTKNSKIKKKIPNTGAQTNFFPLEKNLYPSTGRKRGINCRQSSQHSFTCHSGNYLLSCSVLTRAGHPGGFSPCPRCGWRRRMGRAPGPRSCRCRCRCRSRSSAAPPRNLWGSQTSPQGFTLRHPSSEHPSRLSRAARGEHQQCWGQITPTELRELINTGTAVTGFCHHHKHP